jgi:hypothetical protein
VDEIGWAEGAADRGHNAQQVEKRGADWHRQHASRWAPAGHYGLRTVSPGGNSQLLETARVLLELNEIVVAGENLGESGFANAVIPDGNQTLRLGIGEWTKEGSVNDAEESVFAPMPSVSVRTAVAAKPGDFRKRRAAYRRSWGQSRSQLGMCE